MHLLVTFGPGLLSAHKGEDSFNTGRGVSMLMGQPSACLFREMLVPLVCSHCTMAGPPTLCG